MEKQNVEQRSNYQEPKNWNDDEAKIIREMLFHEGELANHRITWLATLQGLLFAALGFAWKDGKQLIGVLSVLGVAIAISIQISLYYGRKANVNLMQIWNKRKADDYDGPPVIGYGPVKDIQIFLGPWYLLPGLFIVAWLVVLWVNTNR